MDTSPPTLLVGFGKADMSAFEPEMTMFGWGDRKNRARRIHTPLHARAMLVHDPASGNAWENQAMFDHEGRALPEVLAALS